MNGLRQIVLEVSPELFGRLEAHAMAEKRVSVPEWILRTVIRATLSPSALPPPSETEERRA